MGNPDAPEQLELVHGFVEGADCPTRQPLCPVRALPVVPRALRSLARKPYLLQALNWLILGKPLKVSDSAGRGGCNPLSGFR